MPREKITDRLLTSRRIVPATGQVDYWDELLPSFGVRVSYGGRRTFGVLVRISGQLRRITVGVYPAVTLADAREKARKIIADAAAGIGPETETEQRRHEQALRLNDRTFAKVAADFMTDYVSKKQLRTADELKRMLNRDLLPVWGELPIADIRRSHVKELLREKSRVAPIAANRLASLISKLFSWALREDIIEASPAVGIERNAETQRERSLTEAEICALWPALGRIGYPFGHALKFLLITGQRRGEVSNLKWSDLDGNTWKLPGTSAKSGKGHLVPLSTLALETLAACPKIGERVFVARKGAGPINGWEDGKERAESFLASPIAPWRIHDLRRTAATQMRSIGIDRLVVSKILNHAEGGITRIYDRYSADQEKTVAMERWSNRLREIIAGDAGGNVVPMQKLPAAC
jgi:integrase